jgi:outer membrane protein OmpA-like peptidoglycan-associated protein
MFFNEHSNLILRVEEHSDNLGTMQQQMDRSAEWPNAVMNYLMSKGIAKNKIFARGR